MNQPTEVNVKVHGDNSINVDWRGVSTSIFEEPLEGYKVSSENVNVGGFYIFFHYTVVLSQRYTNYILGRPVAILTHFEQCQHEMIH